MQESTMVSKDYLSDADYLAKTLLQENILTMHINH